MTKTALRSFPELKKAPPEVAKAFGKIMERVLSNWPEQSIQVWKQMLKETVRTLGTKAQPLSNQMSVLRATIDWWGNRVRVQAEQAAIRAAWRARVLASTLTSTETLAVWTTRVTATGSFALLGYELYERDYWLNEKTKADEASRRLGATPEELRLHELVAKKAVRDAGYSSLTELYTINPEYGKLWGALYSVWDPYAVYYPDPPDLNREPPPGGSVPF